MLGTSWGNKMKKILLTVILLCTTVFAQPTDSDLGYWPRSYFASIGFGVIANRGDFFDRTIKVTGDDNIVETVNLPQTKVLMSPGYSIGVNIREFSLAATFQYWSMNVAINGLPNNITEQKMRFMRLGADFTYNFFYPEFFQVGIGLGYSFSSLNIKENATSAELGLTNSELMGSSIALFTNVRYYITDFFCLNPSLHFYETWYKAVNTKNAGTQDLKSYVWQTYIAITMNLMVQF